MIVSRTSADFYWKVTDHFQRKPGDWRMLFTEWSFRYPWPSARRRLSLKVSVQAGLGHATGRFTMAAKVLVEGGSSAALSRGAAAELAGLAERLRHRRFAVRPPVAYFPLSAWKKLTPRTVATERRYLSALAHGDAGDDAGAVRTLKEFLDSFRGRSAGSWRPLLASWEFRKPIRIGGRPATAILMLHMAPADLEGRRLGAASSVTIWPPWSGAGALPHWLKGARSNLDRQYRAAGHQAEWHRGPKGRGIMITSMREDLEGLAGVIHERRVLESLNLGDAA